MRMEQPEWNPWHGCHKISEGCAHCYVYRRDEEFGKDSSIVRKTQQFDRPLRKKRDGQFVIAPNAHVYTCMTSDFFVEEADAWREEAWAMIRKRPDVQFTIFTKRIDRFSIGLPADWGAGYPNVTIGCTCENQRRAEQRLPLFLVLPVRRRLVLCEPMLEPIDLTPWLGSGIAMVVAGGESGPEARPLDWAWILALRQQCVDSKVAFRFKQTGSRFVRDGRVYTVAREHQSRQAWRANVDYRP